MVEENIDECGRGRGEDKSCVRKSSYPPPPILEDIIGV